MMSELLPPQRAFQHLETKRPVAGATQDSLWDLSSSPQTPSHTFHVATPPGPKVLTLATDFHHGISVVIEKVGLEYDDSDEPMAVRARSLSTLREIAALFWRSGGGK